MKVFWVLLFAFPTIAHAQTDTVQVKRLDIVRGVDVIAYTFTSPVRWKGNDWLKLGGVVAGTAALSLLDEPVRNFLKGKDCKFLDGFERVGYHYGKPYSAVAFTGGFYLTGVLLKNEWAKETGLMLASGLTTSTIIQSFFKSAVGRARPGMELGNYAAEPFSPAASYHSLPSGHTTVALTISLILARQVESVPIKIFFYSVGAVTATSRLYSDAHWTSDLAFGGAIAWFCADAAVKRLEANRFRSVTRKRKDVIAWKLYPYPGGLSLRARL
jgi:membrane-associated phospholipid phosphatase